MRIAISHPYLLTECIHFRLFFTPIFTISVPYYIPFVFNSHSPSIFRHTPQVSYKNEHPKRRKSSVTVLVAVPVCKGVHFYYRQQKTSTLTRRRSKGLRFVFLGFYHYLIFKFLFFLLFVMCVCVILFSKGCFCLAFLLRFITPNWKPPSSDGAYFYFH